MIKILKKSAVYFIAPILSLLIFILLFQAWKVDLYQPFFSYSHDSLVSVFEAKILVDDGWFFSSSFVGLPHLTDKFYLHDFPLNSELFNFFILKVFTYFSSDPFFISNCFFVLTFALISATSFAVLRHFQISVFTAVIISVLYSFLPYHFYRGIWHLFLSNYAIIPLSIMVSLWIASNKIDLINTNEKRQLCFAPNRFFIIALLISLFAATNGVYYAFYSCIIFVFSWFLLALRNGKFLNRDAFSTLSLCVAIIAFLILLYSPCFVYWLNHGMNPNVANRNVEQSEIFALKIYNLFLPIENHYLDYFAQIRKAFNEAAPQYEGSFGSLGIVAFAGFVFLLIWLVAKSQSDKNLYKKSFFQKTLEKFSLNKNDENLISNLAGLNILTVIYASAGGLVMLVAITFPMLRSHARFSIFIGFIALFLMAIIFDKMIQKKKIIAHIFLSIIFVLALFDQVGRVSAETLQPAEVKRKFVSDRDFVQKIEQILPPQSMIFQMPIIPFPEADNYDLMVGYLNSKNLRWSYPAMRGREADLWQNKVVKLQFAEFISELKKAGFAGIYIDRINMTRNEKKYNWRDLRKFEAQLKLFAKSPALISQNSQLVFYRI